MQQNRQKNTVAKQFFCGVILHHGIILLFPYNYTVKGIIQMSKEYREFLKRCQESVNGQALLFATDSDIFKAHLYSHLKTVIDLHVLNDRNDSGSLLIELAAMRALNLTYRSACFFEKSAVLDALIETLITDLLSFIKKGFSLNKLTIKEQINQYNKNNLSEEKQDGLFSKREPFNPMWKICVGEISQASMEKYFQSHVKEMVDAIIIELSKLHRKKINDSDLFNKNVAATAGMRFFEIESKPIPASQSGHSSSTTVPANKRLY